MAFDPVLLEFFIVGLLFKIICINDVISENLFDNPNIHICEAEQLKQSAHVGRHIDVNQRKKV